MEKLEIPKKISRDEPIGRLIISPFHYDRKKKKLKPAAFAPKASEEDHISTLRFNYCNADFCKKQGVSISKGISLPHETPFIGLALVFPSEVLTLISNLKETSQEISGDNAESLCSFLFTPLNEQNDIRTDHPIYTTDLGFPSHASVYYYFMPAEKDNPINQEFKHKVLKPLAEIANNRFFKDEDQCCDCWKGDEITF